MKEIHWDLTHFTFRGEYENQMDGLAKVKKTRIYQGFPVEKTISVDMNVVVEENTPMPLWCIVADGASSAFDLAERNLEFRRKAENEQEKKVTTRQLLGWFTNYGLVHLHAGGYRLVMTTKLNPLQNYLLKRLGLKINPVNKACPIEKPGGGKLDKKGTKMPDT